MVSRPGLQPCTSRALTWIQCKLGKQYLVKKFTLPWESNPGPTPIRGELATLIVSVGLKNLSSMYLVVFSKIYNWFIWPFYISSPFLSQPITVKGLLDKNMLRGSDSGLLSLLLNHAVLNNVIKTQPSKINHNFTKKTTLGPDPSWSTKQTLI